MKFPSQEIAALSLAMTLRYIVQETTLRMTMIIEMGVFFFCLIKSGKLGKYNNMDKLFTANLEDKEVYFKRFSDVETLRPKETKINTKIDSEN